MYRLLSPVVFGHDRLMPFFRSDAGSSGGGGGNNNNNNNNDDDDDELDDPPSPSSTGNTAADAMIRDYFDRNRSWLRSQNRKLARYRTRARDAENELATVRSASEQQPKATKEDLDELTAYRALGKVDEVKTKVETGTTATQELTTLRRESTIRKAADVAGYNFDVLRDRISNQELLVREVDEDGQKVERVFVKPENGNETPLADYAAQNWKAYLPALVAESNGEQTTSRTATQTQQQFPGQGPARQNNSQGPRSNVQVASAYARGVYSGPPKRS